MLRLLTCEGNGRLVFHEFERRQHTPAYAILSHTWDRDERQEVTYDDILAGTGQGKAAWRKIDFCKRQVEADKLAYFWIDACCINRQSSAELAEAINSMFHWYEAASWCYVFLSDVQCSDWETTFGTSRWFRRGWTLQELLAPSRVEFFDTNGVHLGNKSALETHLAAATGISVRALQHQPLRRFSVPERLMWARHRTTKREEDHVYCLLGIFNVTMPVVYGEGRERAFERLCEEIARHANFDATWIDTNQSVFSTEDLILLQNLLCRMEAGMIMHMGLQNTALALRRAATPPSTSPSPPEQHLATNVFMSANATNNGSITKPEHIVGRHQPSILAMLLRRLVQLASLFTVPLGYFEAWASFQPEKYSSTDLGPQHISYSLTLTKRRGDEATASQALWIAKSQRQWTYLRLVLKISRGTQYWNFLSEPEEQRVSHVQARQMPNELVSLVRGVLTEHPGVDESSAIRIRCVPKLDSENQNSQFDLEGWTHMLDKSVLIEQEKLQRFTDTLRHMDVRLVPETSLVTTYLTTVVFLACLDNRWVGYYNVPAPGSDRMQWWRRVRASIALRGAPDCASLKGIVIDSKRKLMKGILMELPAKGPMFYAMEIHRRRGKPIPWAIREKWAKQIVSGLANFHDLGLTADCIRTYSGWICIDAHDNAVVTLGLSGDHPSIHDLEGLIPPECRGDARMYDWECITPEYDLFQLGLFLWHLYRDQNQSRSRQFCAADGCKSNQHNNGCEIHDDPIPLSRASPDVPDYLSHIINLCRQENPRYRPPARDLLSYFPSDEAIDRNISALTKDEKTILSTTDLQYIVAGDTRLEIARELYGSHAICNSCRDGGFEEIYDCQTCDHGNFDLCPACFAKGVHCMNETHLLKKVTRNELTSTVMKYYSSVKANGLREEIVL